MRNVGPPQSDEDAGVTSGLIIDQTTGQSFLEMAASHGSLVSVEVQLLGGNGTDPRTTSNLCTPETHVLRSGELIKRHRTSSSSMSDHGDQWVTAEIDVQGAKLIRHLIEGDSVLEYTEPQSDEGDAHAKALAAKQGTMLQRETISLQSEATRSKPAKSRS